MPDVLIHQKDRSEVNPSTLMGMYGLRNEVFKERLGWDVDAPGGLERDSFDDFDPVYLIVRSETGATEGCWRLLPTTGPYMLKDVFGNLLGEHEAPEEPGTWEISRFAVSPVAADYDSLAALHRLTSLMLVSLFEFCFGNGIRRVVAVSDVRFERILKRAGLATYRFAPAQRVGNCLSVAGWADITLTNYRVVRSRYESHREQFEPSRLGQDLVSAVSTA